MKQIHLVILCVLLIFTACSENEDEIIYEPTITTPFNLRASQGDYLDQINLSWSSKSPKAYNFHVLRYDDATSDYIKIGETKTKSFEDTTLVIPNTEYHYKVKVHNSEEVFSKLSDSTLGYTGQFISVDKIEVSTNYYGMTSPYYHINWDEVKYADGYEIYRSKSDTLNFEKFKTVKIDSPQYPYYYKNYFQDDNIEPKTDYYYKVRAFNHKLGFSDFSEIGHGLFVLPQTQRPWDYWTIHDCFYESVQNQLQVANKLIGRWKYIYAQYWFGYYGHVGFNTECQNIEVEFLDDYTINLIQNNEVKATTKWQIRSQYSFTRDNTKYYLDFEDYLIDFTIPRIPSLFSGPIYLCEDNLEMDGNATDGWIASYTRVK
ncbi:fibronectin type III domain-containing protein [Seonamhaeicola sp. MEBiC1930]|uniref:hypothetical protein n=1 Tax=Seonamhaeicola sp. MEBiC01930 TaxID=2976768 RepID=UPI003245D49E